MPCTGEYSLPVPIPELMFVACVPVCELGCSVVTTPLGTALLSAALSVLPFCGIGCTDSLKSLTYAVEIKLNV